ncbi:MAG: glutamate 5-kinase [Deltaproteobacteria bacterium]|nr:glutamate 5-kinase [Deltaproteobacteria bacterium]
MRETDNTVKLRAEIISRVRRVVVKVGSGVLTKDLDLNTEIINRLAAEICWLIQTKGVEVLLVSSGAIASGLKKVGLSSHPADIPKKQATAAVGQSRLIMEYEKAFERCGQKVAQILLTMDDLSNRRRYLNARNTLYTLLGWDIVPIINENDTVVVKEIKFGDNDTLSAMITHLMDADLLINLTDIDGLHDKDPRVNSDATLFPLVRTIDRTLEKAACKTPGAVGTGGMYSKVQAAKKVTLSGIPMIIANGLVPDVLKRIFEAQEIGTLFLPRKERMASRKCWIAFTLKPKGVITVDQGARRAIVEQGKSLLPAGIIDVQGSFGIGAPVQCVDSNKKPIATGLVNYPASDIRKMMGLKTGQIEKQLGYKYYDEVIHRDNLVVNTE